MHIKASKKFATRLLPVAVLAVIATTLVSMQIAAVASPTFVSGKLAATRAGEWTEAMQDPIKRAQFAPISSILVDNNPKLKEVLAGADSSYEILINSSGYATPVDPVYQVSITEDESNALLSSLPTGQAAQEVQDDAVAKYSYINLQLDGKYYLVTIMTVGKQ